MALPWMVSSMTPTTMPMATQPDSSICCFTRETNAPMSSCIFCASRLLSVTLATRRGLCRAEAQTFIDASGDAELAAAAGVPTIAGRDEDGIHRPMSLRFVIGNIDIPAMADGLRQQIGPDAIIDANGYLTNGKLEGHFIALAKRADWPE